MNQKNRLTWAIAILLAVVAIGTIGYTLIESWNPFDSFYMTIITLTTIGYGEVYALSSKGRIFTVALVLVGVGSMGYVAGTTRMALAALRPTIVDFLEVLSFDERQGLTIEEFTVREGAPIAGTSLQEAEIGRRLGIVIIAMKKGERMLFNPSSSTRVEPGDVLIAIGNAEQLEGLKGLSD
ncbi:MAG: ion channel [bacterium]